MKNRIKGSAWSSQEPQRALPGGYWRLFPPHTALPSLGPSDSTPRFCVSRLAGGELCVCGFVPFITMQTIFGCSQGRSGIPALFPGFLLVHEKRRNKEEAVVLGLARPWADGDVTGSAAVSGCAGLVMLCPGMACPSPAPPHKASGGERSAPHKVPAKHEVPGDLPPPGHRHSSRLSPARPQPALFPLPAPADGMMEILISGWNGILWNWAGWREKTKSVFVSQISVIASSGRYIHVQISTKAGPWCQITQGSLSLQLLHSSSLDN